MGDIVEDAKPGVVVDGTVNISHVSNLLDGGAVRSVGPDEDGRTRVWSLDGTIDDAAMIDAISRQDLEWSPPPTPPAPTAEERVAEIVAGSADWRDALTSLALEGLLN